MIKLVTEYVQAVMKTDPVAGNELLRCNMKHIMKEMNIPEGPKDTKNKSRKK